MRRGIVINDRLISQYPCSVQDKFLFHTYRVCLTPQKLFEMIEICTLPGLILKEFYLFWSGMHLH